MSATDEEPAIVVGETHHRVEAREIADPEWLVIPERGLYTGIAIFGASRLRKNLRLHESVRPPALRLAGR